MEHIWAKLIFVAFMCSLRGADSLQTLTDLRNALQINSLFQPQNHQPLRLPKIVAPADPPEAVEQQPPSQQAPAEAKIPCTCAVFLSGQFTKGSNEQPRGNPALLQELEKTFPCTSVGLKQCQSKCLETIVKHLPNSAEILCATIDRDCHKERAYLFVKNCNSSWQNSNLSAGREYCCKDNLPYSCPLI